MKQNILFIGMDVHKEKIETVFADGENTEVRRFGKIGGTWDAVCKTLRKLVSTGKALHFCYEAGLCGCELYRHLIAEGHDSNRFCLGMIFVTKVKRPERKHIFVG